MGFDTDRRQVTAPEAQPCPEAGDAALCAAPMAGQGRHSPLRSAWNTGSSAPEPALALTVGAIGTMTLAVMTLASLGHTGRGPERVQQRSQLVTLAAVLRAAAPLDADAYLPMLALSGVGWSGAFGLFVLSASNATTTLGRAPDPHP